MNQKGEPIVIKKLHSKKPEETVENNEIDPIVFAQRQELRTAIQNTNLDTVGIDNKNFYEANRNKLYSDDGTKEKAFLN